MSRCTLFMILLVYVFGGATAALPGRAAAEGPAPAHDVAEDIAQKALSVLYGTGMLEQARQEHEGEDGHVREKSQDILQIHARGPMLAQEDAEAYSPMLAMDTEGPLLAQEDGAQEDGEGPAVGVQKEPPEADGKPADIPPDQEALYQEVRELKKVVEQLRDEAEARDRLRVTDEEERDREAEVLEAAGREYSLKSAWMFGMDLSVSYSYNAYDVIRQIRSAEGTQLEYHANHSINNSLSFESGIRDNLSISATLPFVYKYDQVSTANSRDVSSIGDISLGFKYQPLKTGGEYPSPILNTSVGLPTGRGTYDINPETELATGSGLYRVSQSVSLSQPFDPVNAFASLRYTYTFQRSGIGQRRGSVILEKVDPGDSIGGSLGFGYAVSYRMSLSLSLSYSYGFSTDYYWKDGRKTASGDSVSASLGLSTAWRISPGRTIILGVGKGLTTANPGFSLSFRYPLTFDMR